jgi:hypothetical protein
MPKLLPSELLRLYRLLGPLPHLHLMTSRQPSLLSPPPRLPFELQSDPHRDRKQDKLLHSVLSSDPSKLQAAVRKAKSVGTPAVHLLQVGKHAYTGDSVPVGFYEALLNLKVPEKSPTSKPEFLSTSENYRHIIELAKSGTPLPSLSTQEAVALLERVRPDVLDLFSISARHYLMAGPAGHEHFAALLNLIICNINLSTAAGLNSAWSIMLHKGHS